MRLLKERVDKTKDEIKSALRLEIKQDRESFVIADKVELKSCLQPTCDIAKLLKA